MSWPFMSPEHATKGKCAGPCEQGRKPCQTPFACEVSVMDDGPEMLGRVCIYACIVLLIILVIALA